MSGFLPLKILDRVRGVRFPQRRQVEDRLARAPARLRHRAHIPWFLSARLWVASRSPGPLPVLPPREHLVVRRRSVPANNLLGTHWIAYALLSTSFAAAVFLKGGVYPQQWEWTALGISLAAILSLMAARPGDSFDGPVVLLAVLLGWMTFQLVPLPPTLVAWLSPDRWSAVSAARVAAGQDLRSWLALSVAPAATTERLLDVAPAMAAFVAAREMAHRWRDRPWLVLAPVIGVAWLESLLGLVQFYLLRTAGSSAGSVSGTYVNHNHFAGLLEMAFPLALLCAIDTWKRGTTRFDQPLAPAMRASFLLGVAVCILAAIVVSLSRMGFLSLLCSCAIAAFFRARPLRGRHPFARPLRWLAPVIVPLAILLLLPTRELAGRFAVMTAAHEVSKDVRMGIWEDSLKVAAAYKWTGCGLGAFERGLYRYKISAPANTVDFAHNDYLQILAELGIAGAAVAFALAVWILLRISPWFWKTGQIASARWDFWRRCSPWDCIAWPISTCTSPPMPSHSPGSPAREPACSASGPEPCASSCRSLP